MANKNKDVGVSSKVIKKVEGQIDIISNDFNKYDTIQQNGELIFKDKTTGTAFRLNGLATPLHKNNKTYSVVSKFKLEQLEDGMKKISGLFKKFDTLPEYFKTPESLKTADFTDGKHFEAIIDEFGKIVTTSIEGAKKNTKIFI